MYTAIALGLLLAMVVGLGLLAYRFVGLAEKLVGYLRNNVLHGTHQSLFSRSGERHWLLWFRAWAGLTALTLVVLAAWTGVLRNEPKAMLGVALLGLCATGVGTLLALAVQACIHYVPRARAYAALERHGIHALWIADPKSPARQLRQGIAARIKNSSCVEILDVTGFDLLGKGPGLAGGLLYDTLNTMTGIPVQVLLMEPEARVLDPEQKHATIFQTLLKEMEVTPATYQRKLRATLDAVASLNEKRARKTKIRVRFYAEKPTFRTVLFGESVLVAPWAPRETSAPQPFLEISEYQTGSSFYEGFRRQFARLWICAAPEDKCIQAQLSPSTVLRRQPQPHPTV